MLPPMADLFKLICWAVVGLFRSRISLGAVPTVKSIRLARRVESVDVLPYGGVAPTHLVGPHRAVPVARLAGSRDRCAAPSAQCVAKTITEAADI